MATKEDAISPVFGIIIMVAITVILAAVIALVLQTAPAFKTITVKDKCCSEMDNNVCYVFGTDGNKYTTYYMNLYSKINVGSTYRVKLSTGVYIYDVKTMEEYNKTCEARELC
jgi:flagellin-like protein